jgi:hypothetical protein
MSCRACLVHVEDVKLSGYVSLKKKDLQVQSMWGATEGS